VIILVDLDVIEVRRKADKEWRIRQRWTC